MHILILGSGGREHALAWKLACSPRVSKVYVLPGNAGTARLEKGVQNVPGTLDDLPGLLQLVRQYAIDLTVVGPETPLVQGVVDHFEAAGYAILGPNKAASRLEGSKSFTKDFLRRHHIPTAAYHSFSDYTEAATYIEKQPLPLVIKADGLAAGKGVVITHSHNEAKRTAQQMLCADSFGLAGRRIVVEEFLSGEELSFICLVNGEWFVPLVGSQDHKARDAGDRGPNTGGMGAYSPVPILDSALQQRILTQIIEPTVKGLAEEGIVYRGFLYAGLMIGSDGPRLLEYNVRLGDPETQPLLMRLRSDLVSLFEATLAGSGKAEELMEWDCRPALSVVMAAAGYPGTVRYGLPITGLELPQDRDCHVFHAGIDWSDGHYRVAGGRVLTVTALGDDLAAARQKAYQRLAGIHLPGGFFRRDIAYRALS